MTESSEAKTEKPDMAALRAAWTRIDPAHRPASEENCRAMQEILDVMAGPLGLDPTRDQSFNALEPGLTRAAFMEQYKLAAAWSALNEFYHGYGLRPEAITRVDDFRKASIDSVREVRLPRLERLMAADRTFPRGLDWLERRQVQLLREAKAHGILRYEP